jgi:hypothetical protein
MHDYVDIVVEGSVLVAVNVLFFAWKTIVTDDMFLGSKSLSVMLRVFCRKCDCVE